MAVWKPPFDQTVFTDDGTNRQSHSTAEMQAGAKSAQVVSMADSPFVPLLPASYRVTKGGDKPRIVAASTEFAQDDLCVKRLNMIHRWLWLAGRPMPPRPLSYQQSFGREIVVNEKADMHLVWTVPRRIFVKPIPRYLLDHNFWSTHIATRQDFYQCSFGFLLSYAALIQYESDFHIARDKRLIPENVKWKSWVAFVEQLLRHRDNDLDGNRVNIRYHYGELRLSRLNKIYRAHGSVRGYSFLYQTYGELITSYLAPIAAATVYIAVMLTAMQLGLSTERLANNDAFQRAAFGFTVFSIVAPIGMILAVVLLFLLFVLYNWVATTKLRRETRREHRSHGP